MSAVLYGAKKSPKRIQAILDVLREGGTIKDAARAGGITTTTYHQWKLNDPEFALAQKNAIDEGTDLLEKEAWRRAVKGYDEVVHYQGVAVDVVTKYSDTLLVTLLKMRSPEKFQQYTKNEHTGAGGGPLVFTALTRTIVDPKPLETAKTGQ